MKQQPVKNVRRKNWRDGNALVEMVESETVLQEFQISDQLQEVLMAVVIVEEEGRVQHQEAIVVLPATEGEPAEGKIILPHAAGKFNPAN